MAKLIELLFLIFSYLIVFFYSNSYAQENHFVIASGSIGGNYYKTGKYLESLYNNNTNYSFTAIESNGSSDNIELLKNNYADFAIVQRNVLLHSLYNETEGINNIEVISPLFEEKLHIYYRAKKDISFEEFKIKTKDTIPLKIAFTSKSGYSHSLYNMISRYLGLNKININEHYDNYNILISRFKEKEIDALVSFSLPINELEDDEYINHVFFNENQIKLLESRLPNLFKTKLKKNKNHYTLGSWAFLVGVKNKIEYIDNPNILFNLLHNNSHTTDSEYVINQSINTFKESDNEWKAGILKGIPIQDAFSNTINYNTFNYKNFFLQFLTILFIFSIIYFLNIKKLLPNFSYLFLWHRYKHIVFGVVILAIMYLLSVVLLRISEHNFYQKIGIKSQLLNFSDKDLHFWLLIRNLTGIDNGISPLSTIGKLILSLISYLFWIGSLLIALSEFIVYQATKKRKKGLMKISFEDHIVIVGWNDTTNSFIKDTIDAAKNYNGQKERIVSIVPEPEMVLEKHSTLRKLHSEHKLYFVKGEIRDKITLEKSNIYKAKTVVLLAEDNSRRADERTLLRALAIARFCRRKAIKNEIKVSNTSNYKTYDVGHYIDSIYIIAEVNDMQFKKDLMEADVNEVIVSASYAKGVVIQSILNHGVSKVVDELLQFNEYNEFYTVDLTESENSHLIGKTYDDLLLPLRKQKILLIGIKVIYHDEITGNEIIDETELLKLLTKEGLDRQVIVNPITKAEISRKTDQDDQLVVFSTNRKELKSQISKVTFDD